jgi:Helix-turn-helix domain
MPRAIPVATRQDLIERHLRGQPLPQIAAELGIPFDTVRDLWRAFRDGGADGLVVGYHACGGSTPAYPEAVLRRACRLKREHPGWGGGRIRVELLESLPPDDVPSVRVLQRAFRRAGVNRPRRSQRPRTMPRRAAAPHEVWEVDAVEKARLKTGAEVSWLSVTDVFTGGLLANELSPPAPVAVDHARPGPDAVPRRVPALGVAPAHPGRQRPSLGTEHGIAAGPGVVVDRARRGGGLDPPGPAAEERHDRARQRGDAAVG